MQKLTGESKNISQDNIQKLAQLFPEVISEGKIDFEKLQLILGEDIEQDKERYSFNWHGKAETLRLSQTPSMGTLRPCEEESKDWDTTQNMYIEGDNLEVLKLLQKSYYEKVKMIYIDPPYNTGKDFVYKDNFKDTLNNYKEITGQVDSEGNNYSTNSEANGRYHSDWLNMMYPRLRLARNLLTQDGVIFISIDDNEVANLRKICDEVFGEDNFIAEFIWRGGRRNASKYISTSHEYLLCYTKSIDFCNIHNVRWYIQKKGLQDIYKKVQEINKKTNNDYLLSTKLLKKWYKQLPDYDVIKDNEHYSNIDKKGVYFASDISRGGGGGPKWEIINPQSGNIVAIPSRGWAYSKKIDLEKDILEDKIHFNGDGVPCKKRYLKENETQLLETVFYKDRRGSSKRLKKIFGNNIFPFPKDEDVIRSFVNSFSSKDNDIILDFFSGSATTAHAVMQMNAEDGGNRRFIMVQLPEKTDEKSEAYKAGYPNICEIGKERIRRAGAKILEDNEASKEPKDLSLLDTGFKVFKLDDSNLKKWHVTNKMDIQQELFDAQQNIVEGRTKEDLLYEVILKMGLDLTYPIDVYEKNGNIIYTIGFGALMICLDDNIAPPVAGLMAQLYETNKPETWKVVFLDNGFTDVDKTNSKEILKTAGLEEDNFVTV